MFRRALILLLVASTCLGATTVELKRMAAVRGPDIYLGDIAKVECDDDSLATAFKQVFIRVAAMPGYSCMVNMSDVAGQLIHSGMRARLGGSPQVVVTTESTRVRGSDIVSAARSYVLGQLKREGQEISIELRGRVRDLIIAKGTVSLDPGPLRGASLIGAVTIPVRVMRDGRICEAVQVPLMVRGFRDALVTTKPVSRGESLNERNLCIRKCEITNVRGEVLSNMEDVRGKIAARTLPAGAVLKTDHLAKVEVVQRGELVTVRLNKGSLEIAMKALAMRDGAVGEYIPVQNISSRRRFSARVVGPRTVVVAF